MFLTYLLASIPLPVYIFVRFTRISFFFAFDYTNLGLDLVGFCVCPATLSWSRCRSHTPWSHSDGARCLKVGEGVHEKPDLEEAFHERRSREFGEESGALLSLEKVEFGIGGDRRTPAMQYHAVSRGYMGNAEEGHIFQGREGEGGGGWEGTGALLPFILQFNHCR